MVNCNILLEYHNSSAHIEVAIFPGRPECDVIIGMDLISCGELLIKNDSFIFIIEKVK